MNAINYHTKVIQKLLLIAVACTPLFCLREFLKFSGFTPTPYALYFNLLKDIFLFGIFCLCCFALIKNRRYPAPVLPYFAAFTFFTLLVVALSLYDPLMVVGGLRWVLPLALIFLLQGHVSKRFLQRLAPVIAFLLITTTTVQLYQVATRQFRWGASTYSDWLGRVTGFYELPSTTGFLSCIFLFIIRYYYTGPAWARISLITIAVISNFLLSISTTGFILMLIVLMAPFLYRPGKYRPVFITATLVLGVAVYFFLDTLNGRINGGSDLSWSVREQLMQNQLQNAQLVSSKFGNATNAVYVIKGVFGKTHLGDSTSGGGESFYTPLLGNYGNIFFFLFVAVMAYLLVKVLWRRNEEKTIFFVIVILGAFTVRITEIFPLSILISILAAHFIYKEPETKGHTKLSYTLDEVKSEN